MSDQIAILGWGSLLWDLRPDFDQWHGAWQHDGPVLKIEFCRISMTRAGALTLVLDSRHGTDIQVNYCLTARTSLSLAIDDLRNREGTTIANIGYMRLSGEGKSRDSRTRGVVAAWAKAKDFDAVVWTDLRSNFPEKTGKPFSVDTAMIYLQGLSEEGRRAASAYINHAPDFVDTPLRRLYQATY